ncbi:MULTISPECIES: ScbA/BarX family gamma-butyrolactone biosynthesis protein [Streptomyces]|uniref:ScbA protein n=1 Tax=Streptomyces koelreuteriae TaxID=2838015 RepID=A0ABX8FTJ4_9ACTN|nr:MULTISPECIES: ScbA/BarX family gamma-butyrolactone biosynthesis protein [Streptomyces]QWB24419.1 ScbA protein [Streptomyces koelreuteriae]UUA07424.1 ScbA protein [Streptomyces koelreuteriae]UUA15053.1 ScbA protein [Streptomyces sp. CRCS-T-1]
MPQTGPLGAPTDDQTGRGAPPANRTVAAVENAPQTEREPHPADTPERGPHTTLTPERGPHTAGRTTGRAVTTALAHRTTDTDVFPTRWRRISDTRFRFTAHWPAAHPFFGPVDDRHQDPMIVGETLRQASMVLAHAEFGAPADTHFVMWDLTVRADPSALTLSDAAEPVDIDVVCSEVRRRGRGLSSMRTTMEFRRAGRFVARGTGSTGCTSPLAYRRLRERQLTALETPVPLLEGIAPELAGRSRAEDVVLAPADRPGVWLLRVDTRHPVLFPRPNDHVPGMVLFEAARQAATAATGRHPFLPRAMTARFARYAELHSPCRLETEVLGADPGEVTVRVSGRQGGESVFTATLTSARPVRVRSLS